MTENDKIERQLPEEKLQAINGGGGVISCFKECDFFGGPPRYLREARGVARPRRMEVVQEQAQIRRQQAIERRTTIDIPPSAPSSPHSSLGR